ncbi:MAG: glycosyl transferase [Planctomycetota bacterium]|nr:MAG: glycosyl transferase [Planctomycetota bacterium]
MSALRIGIACYPTYGGSGVLATELGLALADHGHEVHLFSYARPTRLAAFHSGIQFHNVTVSSYPLFEYPPYDLALSSVMRQVMAERELDILHVHYAVPHSMCAYVAREMLGNCRTKIVTTLHGTDITILGRDPSYRDVIPFALRKSDAVVSVSQWLADETRAVFDYGGKIHVLPNFVDETRFCPRRDDRVRNELGGDKHPLVVHMSNFRSLKRPIDAVEAFNKLDRKHGARLVLVGEGPEMTNVRELVCRYELGDSVLFLGAIDAVEDVLAAADVALFPTESESFGLAALEALSSAVPVVATQVGGLPEVVEHGVCGLLAPVGDTDMLAAHLDTLLSDRTKIAQFGAAGRERATELFSLKRSLQQHEALYESLVGAPC